MYKGIKHSCVEGNHVINLFSFSKAYGMMGWRVGYVSRDFPFLSFIQIMLNSHHVGHNLML